MTIVADRVSGKDAEARVSRVGAQSETVLEVVQIDNVMTGLLRANAEPLEALLCHDLGAARSSCVTERTRTGTLHTTEPWRDTISCPGILALT